MKGNARADGLRVPAAVLGPTLTPETAGVQEIQTSCARGKERQAVKFIFASDSFKGSLSAVRITRLLSEEAKRCFPEAEMHCVPVADGGEGTVDALLLALGGERRSVTVTGPLGERVQAVYGVTPSRVAVMEMAQASGLPLAHVKDPMRATSRGTGEMIADALARGAEEILLGIGGSATNDGGLGMLTALGARFFDADGHPVTEGGAGLGQVARVDLTGLMPALRNVRLTVMCDVSNPLLGPKGATAVYGPQKGVTRQMLPILEAGMANYAQALETNLGREIHTAAGSGAAGGLGAALGGVLGAKLKRGIDAVLDAVDFDRLLQNADLVVTGEGCMDHQSIDFGKVIAGVAERAACRSVPVCAIVGSMLPGAEAFMEQAMDRSILTTVNAVMPLKQAMEDAETLYRGAAQRMFRLLRIGQAMHK